jgi:quercetin dioxygenase-like cupin family protein
VDGDDKITFQATSADTDGAYAFWVDEPPGHVGPPKHVHSREEGGFYVIEGQVEFRAGHIDKLLTKDDFIALPKGIPHSWFNTTPGFARLITFTAATGNEGFFLTLGAPGVAPAAPRATLPLEEINARTRRYSVTYMESTGDPLDGALQVGVGRSPTVVRPDEGQRRHACGVVYSVKACGPVTANSYSLIEVQIAPGGIMPSHRHAAFEEGIHVLDGSVRATLDGETYEATVGSFLIIPWGLPTKFGILRQFRTATALECPRGHRGPLPRRLCAVRQQPRSGRSREGSCPAPRHRRPFRNLRLERHALLRAHKMGDA